MDALDWHNLLVAPPPPAPTPRSAAMLARLSQTGRDHYASAVSAWFGAQCFDSPPVDVLVERMLERIEVNQHSPIGAKEIISLDGPYGVGKTTLIHGLAKRLYPRLTRDTTIGTVPSWTPQPGVTHDQVPIMWVQLQAKATLNVAYTSILDFLRFPVHGTGGVLASRTFRALARFGVRILILDDVHKLRESQQASRDIIDALHTINTALGEHGGTLCLVGSELGQRTLLEHPQLVSRLKSFHLGPFTITSDHDKRVWQQFLRGVEGQCLPYLANTAPGFLAQQLPVYVHARTQGHMQDVQQLVKDAVRLAVLSGEGTIDRVLLEEIALSERAQRAEALLRSAPRAKQRNRVKEAS